MNANTPILHAPRWVGLLCLVLGLAALGIMLWSFQAEPEQAYLAYLSAYMFVLSAAIGCMAFIMTAHAANATWPVAVRRLAEAVAPAFPVLALLFIPIARGAHVLYPWAKPEAFEPRVRHLLEHRRAFMNVPYFGLRAAIYFALWCAVALTLRQLSLAMERGADSQRCSRRLRVVSYASLPILALVTALTAFEWLMSLSPEYSSTMYGANWIAMCLFAGQALTILLTGLAQRSQTPLPAPGPSHYSALGRLLFAYLIFLGYTEFFQFLLGWIGDRPSEAQWFLERSRGIYYGTVMFLILGHFFLPFALLLSFRRKRRIQPLSWIALWCLLSHYIHVHWLVTPSAAVTPYSLLDLIALIAVLGISAAVCLWAQQGKALVPSSDPRYAETFSYESR